jgi:hypothetical protein
MRAEQNEIFNLVNVMIAHHEHTERRSDLSVKEFSDIFCDVMYSIFDETYLDDVLNNMDIEGETLEMKCFEYYCNFKGETYDKRY